MQNWKKLFTTNFYFIFLIGVTVLFFYPTFLMRKIPIPADTIVGMYHPWRDNIWDNFVTGVPYKNFLITDPVRQQYIWRKLVIDELRGRHLPLWNPYSFSGTPLLANFQSASFYPLNILFFILPFNAAWTFLVILQPLLSGVFLYLYLRYMKVSRAGSFLGGFSFAFSGFSIAWLEWNTIGHVILWLPLTLLSIEKIIAYYSSSEEVPSGTSESRSLISKSSRPALPAGRQAQTKRIILWLLIFIISLSSSFFAGHLQIFFYAFILTTVYTIIRIVILAKSKCKTSFLFFILYSLFFIITSVQWIPTYQFIIHSARDFDQGSWTRDGWFIPWQNLMQFLAPDFFGNPATNNYWGIWNYGEFIGYIGIAPLIFALYAFLFRRDKKVLFFGSFAFLALIFALPTPLARLPYEFKLPLISTSQPTRLMFILDFSLSILAAFGFDLVVQNLKNHNGIKKPVGIILILSLIFSFLWLIVLHPSWIKFVPPENILIAKRNLVLPTIIISLITISIVGFSFLRKRERFTTLLYSIVVVITVVELFRFGWKFTPFTKEAWIFPQTNILKTISGDKNHFRIMVIDRKILPPNFVAAYKIADVSGYDPLYLQNYNQLVSAWERNKPDISPASFNRIVTPGNYESYITDLLGIKYIMSLTPIKSEKLEYLSQEGETYLYINKEVFPRTFLVENVTKVNSSQEAIDMMFSLGKNLRDTGVVEEDIEVNPISLQSSEKTSITYYSPNYITVEADVTTNRFLVLSDIYYPTWRANTDGKPTKIYKVDFAFRGVLVPEGKHIIEFKNNLL